jgi:uncharacterized protein (DUF1499 family)
MTDFKTLKLSWKPNQYLVTPTGWGQARPHRESPVFGRDPAAVYAAIKAVALDQPRVQLLSDDPTRRKLELVQRTRIVRFPDFVSIEVAPVEGQGSTILVYSRAKFGIRDFGVNRRRIDRWLALLADRLAKMA